MGLDQGEWFSCWDDVQPKLKNKESDLTLRTAVKLVKEKDMRMLSFYQKILNARVSRRHFCACILIPFLCHLQILFPGLANAQNITNAPYSVWAEKHNVSGMYTSGQEVCDAKYPNHPDGMVYVDYGAGDQGGCWNPVRNEWGISPGRWYVCPSGYDPEGWTLFDAMPPPAYFKGKDSYCIGSSNIADPSANLGIGACIGNPINAGTGNKYQVEDDFPPSHFSFRRFYNSDTWGKNAVPDWQTHLGLHWRGSYDHRVSVVQTTQATTAYLNRPSGQFIHFRLSGSSWIPNVSDRGVFSVSLNSLGQAVGYLYVTADEEFEYYDLNGRLLTIANRAGLAKSFTYSDGTTGVNGGYILGGDGNPTAAVLPAGLLIRITDTFGRRIAFGYDALKRIVKVTDVEEGRYLYLYDASNRLSNVTYPDNQIRQYHYNESDHTNGAYIPHALTGITDERGGAICDL